MIPEDVASPYAFPNFSTLVSGMLREVLDNDNTTRDIFLLNGSGITKGKSGGVSMMLKTGMEVAQYYTILNYGPPIPPKYLSS